MARIRSQRSQPRLAHLLFLAGTAFADTFSLSNFQLITQSSVPISCILAYNNKISGCVETDFENGNTCSAACIRGIEIAEDNIQSACEGVPASANTVLGQALLGNLAEFLCPGADDEATTTARTTLDRGTSTRIRTTIITPTPDATTQLPPAAEPSTDNPQQPPAPATTSTRSTARATQTPQSDSGGSSQPGGSPFDVFNTGAGSPLRSPSKWIEAIMVAATVGIVLLR